MVTITLSMLVLFALMSLIDTGGKARARISDKTESVQRLRNGMDRITRILRTQVCADTGTPPLISGTASSVTFYSDTTTTASNSAFRPRKVELSYSADDNGSIVQKVWEPTNTASPWTYPNAACPTRVNTLIDNATAADGADEVFSYYAFDAINTPLAPPAEHQPVRRPAARRTRWPRSPRSASTSRRLPRAATPARAGAPRSPTPCTPGTPTSPAATTSDAHGVPDAAEHAPWRAGCAVRTASRWSP